jgi:hypothetical protein
MPSAAERRKIDAELRKLGFGGLQDPNLNQQIAFFIRNHEQFRNQLFSVEPEKRKLAYDQLRPHLRFPAKPLDVYEAEMKEIAEQKQLPTLREGEVYPTPYKPGEVGTKPKIEVAAEKAIEREAKQEDATGHIFLVCRYCLFGQAFVGENRKAANADAFDEGWRMDGEKPLCPKCCKKRGLYQ